MDDIILRRSYIRASFTYQKSWRAHALSYDPVQQSGQPHFPSYEGRRLYDVWLIDSRDQVQSMAPLC